MTGPRWRLSLLLGAVGVFLAVVYVGSFLLSTTHDRPDRFDNEGVRRVVAQSCTQLVGTLSALPPLPADASAAQRADRIGAQDDAVRQLVTGVRSVGAKALAGDSPGEQWLADWTRLADLRDAAAKTLRVGGSPAYAVPVEDGRPITVRMNMVGVATCAVPQALTTLP